MPQLSVGFVIALIVLVVSVVLFFLGQLSAPVAVLLGMLAVARMT